MRATQRAGLIVGLSLTVGLPAQTPLGTEFTYQGRLTRAGAPADGSYDFVFRLFDAATGGLQVGGDVSRAGWPVTAGLFTAPLDFGAGVFTGGQLWLEVAVRPSDGGGPFTTLAPRQPLTATPYAMYALSGPGSGDFWAATGADIHNTNTGKVGIGTTAPVGLLGVESTANTHGVWSIVPWIAVYGHRTGTSGTWPAVHGDCDSLSANASAVRGIITSTTPGAGSAGVKGINNGTGSAGVGVLGTQAGSGYGVQGTSISGTGVVGESTDPSATTYGVRGTVASPNGYAGYFTGGRSYFEGYVGIGTAAPDAHLDVSKSRDSAADYVLQLTTWGTPPYWSRLNFNGSSINADGSFGSILMLNDGGGDVRMGYASGQVQVGFSGAVDSAAKLNIQGGTDSEPAGGGFLVIGNQAGVNISMDDNEIMARNNGAVSTLYLNNDGGEVHVGGATSIWGNLTIRSRDTNAVLIELGEGLDYAEGFDVSDKDAITPGAVVVIDPRNPGKLMLSTAEYDRKVAGIVAGANGLGSAVRLGAGQFDHDVALAGRVYCQVDATEHGIEPGDLLTTASRPGHAMKVTDHARAQGAILGKAMEPLKQGETGQILVLVTLQ